MKTIIHKAETRGHVNHDWLNTHHTFSFANYYNPERVRFGVLRVLNDDTIGPGKGFGMHPHDNMEIITIPLKGDLEHRDSMGNAAVIHEGEIQVMSAGTGIYHSELNKNDDKEVRLLQIWIFPDKKNVTPRNDQNSLKDIHRENAFHQVLSPRQNDQGVWIHQEAWFHLGRFAKGKAEEYKLKKPENGAYFFILEGDADVNGEKLSKKDGMGIWDTDSIYVQATENTRILLMEVPMR